MKKVLKINKTKLSKTVKADCRLEAFSVALDFEGLDNYTPSEIILDSNSIAFDFLNINKAGSAVYTALGVSSDLFKRFSNNTGIKIDHISSQSEEEDFNTICQSIDNNHCVMASIDRYGLFKLINPKMYKNISEKKHMPYHTIIIYGYDIKKKSLLVCEPSTAFSKYHSMWINSKALSEIRCCEFMDLSIDRDLFIISDIGSFIKPDPETMLNQQIDYLHGSITSSLPLLKDFVKAVDEISENQTDMIRYYSIQTIVLSITTGGFDKSMMFYRGLLLELCQKYYKKANREEILTRISHIANQWAHYTKKLVSYRNKYSYQELLEIWNWLLIEAKSEQSFCMDFAIKN